MNKLTHGGKRKGAGRKPALLPLHTKKLRASEAEWQEFLSYLADDATKDFEILIHALAFWRHAAGLPVHRGVPAPKKQSNDR